MTYTQIPVQKHRVDYNMLESGDVFDGMSSVRDNAFVNYDVTTVKVNTSSDISTCDVSGVQIRNISNNEITCDKECIIPNVSTVTGMGECTYHS